MINHIELWGISRQIRNLDATAIDVLQQPSRFLVATEAIPNHQ
jgi:hypothetical protein